MKTLLHRWVTQTSVPIATCLISASSFATIDGVEGVAILMAPPASVVPGAVFGDVGVIHSFVERESLALLEDVDVDLSPVGLDSIPAGTCVSTHLMHFDPPGPSVARGAVHFARPILGVIRTQAGLDSSNAALGERDVTYPTLTQCQVPPLAGDCALESVDVIEVQSQNVDVEFHANGPGDRVRVITEGDPDGC